MTTNPSDSFPAFNSYFALISGFFLAMHFATWISSLNFTSVANSVVLVNTNPLWVGLLTPLIANERLKKAAIISILMSVIGGVLILFAIYIAASAENETGG